MNKVDFRVYDKITQDIVNVVSINFHTGSLIIESTDDSGMDEIRHLEDIELESNITTRDKDLSMQALMDLPIESLAKEVQSLEYGYALLNSSTELYYDLYMNMVKRVANVKDYLDIEISKNNMKYEDTDNIEYYYRWLALVGFKEGIEEILKEKIK